MSETTSLFMTETNYRLSGPILTLLCLSALLFNGCTLTIPKLLKSSSIETEKDKVNTDKPSMINDESRMIKTTAKHDMPFTKAKKDENKPSAVLGKEYLSEGPSIGMKMVGEDEGLKVLEKVKELEARLKEEENERKKTGVMVKELNKKISDLQSAEAKAVAAKQGSGYLSDGPTIQLGIIDGDEELKVLEKVRRVEARLEAEKKKVSALGEEMTKLQAAREHDKIDFANIKKELEEKNNYLLERISTLESELEVMESRAITAEQELNPVKKELLKTQISETKAQQELYKLRIENLKTEE